MKNNKAELMYQMIMHIILVAFICAMFFFAMVGMAGSRGVRQQVLEKQTALLIDAADSGVSISIFKKNQVGKNENEFSYIENIRLQNGRVLVDVDGLKSIKGYRYFNKNKLNIEEKEDRFVISIK